MQSPVSSAGSNKKQMILCGWKIQPNDIENALHYLGHVS